MAVPEHAQGLWWTSVKVHGSFENVGLNNALGGRFLSSRQDILAGSCLLAKVAEGALPLRENTPEACNSVPSRRRFQQSSNRTSIFGLSIQASASIQQELFGPSLNDSASS